MAGGALLAVGSVLAWAVLDHPVEPISYGGLDEIMDRHGWVTLVAGVVLVGAGLMKFLGASFPMFIGWLAFAVGAVIAGINFFSILGEDEWSGFGIGMWLLLAGVVVSVFGLMFARETA